MSYEIYDTVEEAIQISVDGAIAQGCSGTTNRLWTVFAHADGRGAVDFDDDCARELQQELGFELVD